MENISYVNLGDDYRKSSVDTVIKVHVLAFLERGNVISSIIIGLVKAT